MSGMPLETCCAFNERRNNIFYYKVASCWLFLLNHTTMHGSTNIKFCVLLCIFCVVLCIFVLFYVFLCFSMYCLFCVVLWIVCMYMCTVLLPPGGYPIAVKYIISYISYRIVSYRTVSYHIIYHIMLIPHRGYVNRIQNVKKNYGSLWSCQVVSGVNIVSHSVSAKSAFPGWKPAGIRIWLTTPVRCRRLEWTTPLLPDIMLTYFERAAEFLGAPTWHRVITFSLFKKSYRSPHRSNNI